MKLSDLAEGQNTKKWIAILAIPAVLINFVLPVAALGGMLIVISAAACEAWDSVPIIGDCEGITFGDLVSSCQAPAPPIPANAREFVELYGDFAYDIGEEYGIPYDAILAQAALESGWGASKLTTEAFNFFGIKAGSGWDGPVYTIETEEQDANGNVYTVVADFRKYPNAEEGFRGYAEFIHDNSRYSEALNYPNDPVRYLTEIREAGYATDVNYVDKVVGILEQIQAIIRENDMYPPSTEAGSDAVQAAAQVGGTAPPSAEGVPEHTGDLSWPVEYDGDPHDLFPDGGLWGDPREHGPHHGLDFTLPLGEPILAVADGKVVFADAFDPDGYGTMIKIEHTIDGEMVETWYAHMPDAQEFVQEGDTVEAGERIASIGQAGNSTGPHLHFEVHPNGGEAINPLPWLETNGATATKTGKSCGGNGDISGVEPPEKDGDGNWPAEECSVEPDPTTNTGCVTPRTATAAEMIQAWGASEVYCYSPRASGYHPQGRACDVTFGEIGTRASGSDKATGDRLAEFLQRNTDTWAVMEVIWYGEIWTSARADEGWRPYTGSVSGCDVTETTCGHYDHVHVTIF